MVTYLAILAFMIIPLVCSNVGIDDPLKNLYDATYESVVADLAERKPKIGQYEPPFYYRMACDHYSRTVADAIEQALMEYEKEDKHQGVFIVETCPPKFILYYTTN